MGEPQTFYSDVARNSQNALGIREQGLIMAGHYVGTQGRRLLQRAQAPLGRPPASVHVQPHHVNGTIRMHAKQRPQPSVLDHACRHRSRWHSLLPSPLAASQRIPRSFLSLKHLALLKPFLHACRHACMQTAAWLVT